MRAIQQHSQIIFLAIAGIVLLEVLALHSARAQSLDSLNPAANNIVSALAIQADGRILVGGHFTQIGGLSRMRIARLQADGAVDPTFAPAANDTVYSLAIQPDGKVLVGGDFTSLAGGSKRGVGRLNTNGTLDTGFTMTVTPPPDFTYDIRVQTILIQPDGKIIVGGRNTITRFSGPAVTTGFNLRLNPNGTTDNTFITTGGVGGPVSTMAQQSDGKLLLGGLFTTLRNVARNRMGRLNADGSLDVGFDPNVNGGVFAVAIQADEKILIGGNFTTVAGQPRTNLARLHPDGSLDDTYAPAVTGGATPVVYSLAVQTDEKVLVGGLFTTVAGQARMNLARLNPEGTLDQTFTATANNLVYGLALQADGKILAGGQFFQLGGQPRSYVGRLNNTAPATQALSDDGANITWLRGGTSPEVWRTTFDVSTNLTNWTYLGEGLRIPGGWQLTGLALPGEGRIRARGFTRGGGFNGSTWFAETVGGPCSFQSQPSGRTNNAGTGASFTTAVNGSPPISYQWLKDGSPLTDGGAISGAHTTTLNLTGVLGGDAGGYSVIASNSFGSVTSVLVTLKVIDPWITSQPTASTNLVGTAITFGAGAQGAAPLSYQWRKNGVDLDNTGNISGVRTPYLTLTNVSGGDAGIYSLRVTNSSGVATSSSAMLKVLDPFIVSQPINQFAPPGQTVQFSVTISGTPPLNYQWRKNGVNLIGPNAATITVTNLLCAAGGAYDVIVSNGFGSVTSSVGLLTVEANSAIIDSWNPGAGNEVYSQAMFPDGRVLVGGGPFSTLGGQPRNYIGLINNDGDLATNFNPTVNSYVYAQLIQNDGRIVIGGQFSSVGGQPRQRLARLNADGSLDTGFNSGVSDPIYMPRIKCLAQQPDGKIIVGGVFSTLGGEPHLNIGRLNSNGTVDSTFTQWADWVSSIIVQPDGKILVGGTGSLKRLNPNGTLDGEFQAIFGGGSINAVALQHDGKILVGGVFNSLAGQPRQNIGRLNPDGSLDSGFRPSADNAVASIFVQCDGKILLTGYFTNLCNQIRRHVGRLNSDGYLDCTFNPGVAGGSYPVIYSLLTQIDGRVLLGGYFGSISGQPRSSLGRLENTEPALAQLSFDGVRLTWLRGGTSPEVSWTTFEVSSNGTSWDWLGNGERIPGGWELANVPMVANVTVRARGLVQAAGNYSGGGGSSSWFVEETLAIGTNLPPRILTKDDSFGFRTNQISFNVVGLVGSVIVVEASTNLIHWLPIHTNLVDNLGAFHFLDSTSGLYQQRFYRARLSFDPLPPP